MSTMESPRSRRPWALLVILLVGAVFILVLMLLRRPSEKMSPAISALPELGVVPAFALTDAGGQQVTRETLAGKIWVADFIFTTCGGTCPMMTSTLYQLNTDLEPSWGVYFASISVDPEHDTPEVLRAYADNNGLPRARWWFLTGTRESIYSLAKDGFHLAVADSASSPRLITHSSKLALVDRTGHIRGYYEGTDSTAVPDLRRDIAMLMLEPSGGER